VVTSGLRKGDAQRSRAENAAGGVCVAATWRMVRTTRVSSLVFFAVTALVAGARADERTLVPRDRAPELAGDPGVHLVTSCAAGVAPEIDRGLALLYVAAFEDARATFEEVATRDQSCAMAHWGVAMSHRGSMWDGPLELDLAAGAAALQKGFAAAPKTTRELDYLYALNAFFDPSQPSLANRQFAFEKGMQELHERYPEDLEAAVLYAGAVLEASAISRQDRERRRWNATEALAGVLSRDPDHPGARHFFLHTSDDSHLHAEMSAKIP
jgi:hypothetical protein